MKGFLFLFLYLVPRNGLSLAFGWLARRRWPWFSRAFKIQFARLYRLNMSEAQHGLESYPNLHELFIRRLRPDARPLAMGEIVCPVDGKVSMHGTFDSEITELMQAKGISYTLDRLVGSTQLAERFAGGVWGVIYLAPWNYHRIHNPADSQLLQALYIPGTLWPVNEISVRRIPELFCVNERLISHLQLAQGGEMLVVKVGATNVGRISLAYTSDIVTNSSLTPAGARPGRASVWKPHEPVSLAKGAELGCFELGSTVVLVADAAVRARHPHLFTAWHGKQVWMGQGL